MLPSSSAQKPPRISLRATVFVGVVTALALSTLAACDDSVAPAEPNLGSIEVTTLTESDGPPPQEYTVLFNGDRSGTVGPNDVFTIPSLPAGQYEVALEEEPDRCWFGSNYRTLTVEANQTTFTTFLVRCDAAPPGEPQNH